MFKFSEKEIEAMESELESLCSKNIETIKASTQRIFSAMEKENIDPKIRFGEIASQEKWDGKSYGGDCRFAPGCHGPFAGGLQESVFSNMFHDFGLYAQYTVPGYIIPCILVYRAMREDNRTDLYVRSILSGSRKVNDVMGQWDERSRLIYKVITSIMETE